MAELITNSIEIWRAKAREGTLTKEEMREALAAIRASRTVSAERSAAKKAKTGKAPVDSESLLGELDLL